MPTSNEQILDQQDRLLRIREHLRVRSRIDEREFEGEVIAACISKVRTVLNAYKDCRGEVIIAAIGQDLGVRFEEVRGPADIRALEQKYLVEQRELGFGRLETELADSSVDALLFRRTNAADEAPDRWVAVINLQQTEARAYWSRPHEIMHRLAEPPQGRLRFYRHRHDTRNRVERLMDLGAAEIAFPPLVFEPLVLSVAGRDLTWTLVESIRKRFAPTASLQATAKAIMRFWPTPVFLLTAMMRGRKNRPAEDVALRVDVDGFSPTAEKSSVYFFENMRVPASSPIWHAHENGGETTDFEHLDNWTTRKGEKAGNCRAVTSGLRLGSRVYGLLSLR